MWIGHRNIPFYEGDDIPIDSWGSVPEENNHDSYMSSDEWIYMTIVVDYDWRKELFMVHKPAREPRDWVDGGEYILFGSLNSCKLENYKRKCFYGSKTLFRACYAEEGLFTRMKYRAIDNSLTPISDTYFIQLIWWDLDMDCSLAVFPYLKIMDPNVIPDQSIVENYKALYSSL